MPIRGWPRRIAWREFTEVNSPPAGEDGQAYTYTPFSYRHGRSRQDRTGWRLEGVEVRVSVGKSQSWVVKGKQHRDLLKHEQGHFDITGLVGGRELFNKLTELRTKHQRDLMEQRDKIYSKISRKVNGLHLKYDNETKDSADQTIVPAKQKKWDELIQSRIQKTDGKKYLPDPS